MNGHTKVWSEQVNLALKRENPDINRGWGEPSGEENAKNNKSQLVINLKFLSMESELSSSNDNNVQCPT